MGNWIQLTSGGGYDFDRAQLDGPFVMERDLAYPLAGINRYVRHTNRNWSVAIHSVAVALTIEKMGGHPDEVAAGLLHDAHEAIVGDIPTPVAWHVGYEKVKELKQEVQNAIHFALDIAPSYWPQNHKSIIDIADRAALHVERQMFMVPERQQWNVAVPSHDWMLAMYETIAELTAYDAPSTSLASLSSSYAHNHDDGMAAFIGQYKRLIVGGQ